MKKTQPLFFATWLLMPLPELFAAEGLKARTTAKAETGHLRAADAFDCRQPVIFLDAFAPAAFAGACAAPGSATPHPPPHTPGDIGTTLTQIAT